MTQLQVAIDVTPLVGTRTGIGYAAAGIVEVLERRTDVTLLPFTLSRRARGAPGLPAGVRAVPYPARMLLETWSRTDRPSIDRWIRPARLVHATNYLAPPSKKPVVVTVHDCWFIRHPEQARSDLAAYEAIVRRAVARGAWVHAISDYGAREIRDVLDPPAPVRVVPLAAPAVTVPAVVPVEIRSIVDGAPFVLALGSQEPRKNLVRLVGAFAAIADRVADVTLVFAGPDGAASDELNGAIESLRPATAARVVRLGTVSDTVRASLLGNARALAFPSLDEGFGLPITEAMSVGTPVLGADAGAIPEVAGNAAVLVDPLDVDAIAAGLERVLTDQALRERLVIDGRRRVEEYTWERTGNGLVDLYRDLLS